MNKTRSNGRTIPEAVQAETARKNLLKRNYFATCPRCGRSFRGEEAIAMERLEKGYCRACHHAAQQQAITFSGPATDGLRAALIAHWERLMNDA
jgi:hypothetical protein